ncbi:hypothetical protein Tco_0373174 [Tanacetum coccineum]
MITPRFMSHWILILSWLIDDDATVYDLPDDDALHALWIVTISGCLKSYELKILKIFAPSLTNNRRKVIIEISGDTGEKKVTEENRVFQAP